MPLITGQRIGSWLSGVDDPATVIIAPTSRSGSEPQPSDPDTPRILWPSPSDTATGGCRVERRRLGAGYGAWPGSTSGRRVGAWLGAVPVDVLAGEERCVGWAEVSSVALEHRDPLVARGVGRFCDQVGGISLATAGHPDVRVRCAGGFADAEVGMVDGVALGAVRGGRVGQFDVVLDVPPRQYSRR